MQRDTLAHGTILMMGIQREDGKSRDRMHIHVSFWIGLLQV